MSHLTHTHLGSSRESCACHASHPHVHEVSDCLRLCSLLLPHASPVALLPLLPALEVCATCCAFHTKRVWTCLTSSTSPQIQRKSRKRRQAKVCDRTGQPVVHRTLAKTPNEWLSRIHSFVTDRSFTADGGLLPLILMSAVSLLTNSRIEPEKMLMLW